MARRLELAVVTEPENGDCPPGYTGMPDGRCVRLPDSEDDVEGLNVAPSEIVYDTPDAKSGDDCAEGYHKMPDGSCMSNEEMSPTFVEPDAYAADDNEDDNDTYEVTPTWEGVLTVEGVESGDGRLFEPGSLTWGEPPLPLMWQKETAHGQGTNTSVRVGSVTDVWREDDPDGRDDVKLIKGRGVIDVGSPDGAEVHRRMNADPPFLNTNSVDVDMVKDADVEMRYEAAEDGGDEGLKSLFSPPELTVFKKGRVRGTTLVEFPAFVEAQLALTNVHETETEPEPLVAADGTAAFGAVGTHSTATTDSPWDGPANEKRLSSPMPRSTAARMYAYVEYKDEITKSDGKLPHHMVSADGTPGAANLRACSAAIAALNGARGGVKGMSAEDRRAAYNHVAAHLRAAGREPPELQQSLDEELEALVAATHVMTISDTPPRTWFDEPTDVAPRGALTVTDEGRVYGFLAPAKVRHRSFHGKNVTAPLGKVDYSRFMGGETIVADGGRVTTGVITMDCGHATTEYNLTAGQAQEHYDNTCSVVASVRVGENKSGVWVAGALLPGVKPEQVQKMMSCRLSGDWRAHLDRPGWRELAAALLVPVPGFAMSRSAPSVETRDGQLVASSMPVRFTTVSTLERKPTLVQDTRITALRNRVRVVDLRARVETLHGTHNPEEPR